MPGSASNMGGSPDGFGCLILIILSVVSVLFILPVLLVSGASVIVGITNYGVNCSTANYMSLPLWLILSSIIGLIILGVTITLSLNRCWNGSHNILIVRSCLVIILAILIMNINGCIVLFGYSSSCVTEVKSLWGLSLTTLIIQWISLIVSIIVASINKCRVTEYYTVYV